MAIEKVLESPQGVPCSYHRITHLQINWPSAGVAGIISAFYSKETRNANKGSVENTEFNIAAKKFPFADVKGPMKNLLGMGDNQDLVSMKMFFDGPTVHISAAYVIELNGLDFNQEIQFNVPKEKLPVDFLAPIYAELVLSDRYKD